MSLTPLIISINKGADETYSIFMNPPQTVDGWTLEFRAKSAAVNPDTLLKTILFEDISADVTEITVSTAVGFPYENEFKIRIDNEVLQVTSGSGFFANGRLNLKWVVERGAHGTTAATHTARARITLFSQPQLLLDNGNHGGVVVQDADVGIINLEFAANMTADRPTGTYFWNLRRTDAGYTHPIRHGLLYLLPDALSGLLEPPTHN